MLPKEIHSLVQHQIIISAGRPSLHRGGSVRHILMKKTLLAGIAVLSVLSASAAHAGQRPHVVVGKPKIVYTTIRGAMFPPPKYDKPYDGELEIRFFSSSEDVRGACPSTHSDAACASHSVDGKKCWIMMGTEDVIKSKGFAYAFALRHELAHCNGWKHPNTTDGKKFNVGDKWDEAEGAKWVAANTKVSMPKLPALTRILPASPPVVCVTPDWQPEPCKERESKDIWSTARPLQKSDVR